MLGPIKLNNYPDAISVHQEERLAHVVVGVTLQELLAEPDVEALVVLPLQLVALSPKTVHGEIFASFEARKSEIY